MATFKTRYGVVSFKSKRTNPSAKGRKKSAPKAKPKAKAYSKKVGSWRCECKGRTVTCAGAKHSYRDHGTACGVYKRITSVGDVKRFVARYGKQATKAAVGAKGAKTNPKRKKATAAKRRKKVAHKAKKAKSRRNPPIRKNERDAILRILRRHGYR